MQYNKKRKLDNRNETTISNKIKQIVINTEKSQKKFILFTFSNSLMFYTSNIAKNLILFSLSYFTVK